jgi:hypothetical protein
MKRVILASVVLIQLMAIYCRAAAPAAEPEAVPKEEPSSKPAADVPQPVIPERKLTFDISEEEQPTVFIGADPELFEQHYVATFSLIGPVGLAPVGFTPIEREQLQGYRHAVERHHRLLLGVSPIQYAQLLKSALSEIPQERSPSEDVVSLLTKATPYFSFLAGRRSKPGNDEYSIAFTILAPTPERAKELVQGVLSFYDYAVFYPLQKGALAMKAACQKRLEQDRAGLEEAQSLAPLQKQLEELKEYADITPEALAEFTTQQRLISVDMQGVKARIDACNKILLHGDHTSRTEQLETLKVTAEIELVGLIARKEALEQIVKKGQERKDLFAKRVQVQRHVRSLESEIRNMSEGIRHYEAELAKCIPYPVEGGKVVIRRIKWVPPGYSLQPAEATPAV